MPKVSKKYVRIPIGKLEEALPEVNPSNVCIPSHVISIIYGFIRVRIYILVFWKTKQGHNYLEAKRGTFLCKNVNYRFSNNTWSSI